MEIFAWSLPFCLSFFATFLLPFLIPTFLFFLLFLLPQIIIHRVPPKFLIPVAFLWVTSTCSQVDTKVLKKHTASICTLTLKMEAARSSKRLAATASRHLSLLPATFLFSIQTVHSLVYLPTSFPFQFLTCSLFSLS